MEELVNCPNCNEIFVKSKFRDVCPKCWKQEEEDYNTVYQFMRKRENRAATIEQVVRQTGVKEELVLKFIKKGRIQITHFPNLGYPCDRCGRIIRTGKLCENCTAELREDLQTFQSEEKRKLELLKREKATYYSAKD
ncbi:TIGR03826 family flagellar region protein [Neobacillus sp. SM06]|uniref:TIGR03826 family flagellar region protein n=1 Tax=Neobacillus sp. SM06 TaxID=3422492 RepID=UPI003D2CB72A